MPSHHAPVPPIETLPLHDLLLDRYEPDEPDEEVEEEEDEDERVLPAGPWLRTVRRLGAPLAVLLNSVDVLRRAPALEYVYCTDAPDLTASKPEAWRAFWRWAAQHPSLRRLRIATGGLVAPPLALVNDMLELQRARPEVQACCCGGKFPHLACELRGAPL